MATVKGTTFHLGILISFVYYMGRVMVGKATLISLILSTFHLATPHLIYINLSLVFVGRDGQRVHKCVDACSEHGYYVFMHVNVPCKFILFYLFIFVVGDQPHLLKGK